MPHDQQKQRQRIVVPTRAIQGGFDTKFEVDPYSIELYGLLTSTQYTEAIQQINDTIAPSRSKKLDGLLLAAGPLMVPLALWGIRHSNQNRRRKKLRKIAIDNFNIQYPTLLMRWNRKPESKLTIERRRLIDQDEQEARIIASQQQQQQQQQGGGSGPPLPEANANLVSDVVAVAEPITGSPPRVGRQQQQQPDLLS